MNLSRRSFLIQAGVAAIPMVPGCATIGLATHRVPLAEGKATIQIGDFPELSVVGGGIKIRAGGFADPIFLVHLDQARYIALSAVCTHLGCLVRKRKTSFRCPCHGSAYDLEGNVLRGPAQEPMTRLRTEVDETKVTIFFG